MANSKAIAEFRRASVGDQVAVALSRAIRSGVWGKVLPGELELARRLGTSRDSVRSALAQLAKDGLVDISKGRRTQIRSLRQPSNPVGPAVCLFAPVSRDALRRIHGRPVLLELHAEIADRGIAWEEIYDATLGSRPGRRLKRLVADRPGVSWLLLGASAEIQRWFQDAAVPVLVMGTCHSGIKLPCVDTNYRAVGWHAAGCMAHMGHRNVALVLPFHIRPGDLACRDGFTDYMAQRESQVSVTEITADPDRTAFGLKLDALMARNPRPTAILSMQPENTLTVFGHLLLSGLQIPKDVSLVSRDTHGLFEMGLSELTRYSSPAIKMARRIARISESLLAGHRVRPKPSLIMPTFVAGRTLGRPVVFSDS